MKYRVLHQTEMPALVIFRNLFTLVKIEGLSFKTFFFFLSV